MAGNNSRRTIIIEGNTLVLDFRQVSDTTNEETFSRRARSGKLYRQRMYSKKAWSIGLNSGDQALYNLLHDAWDNSPVEFQLENESGTMEAYQAMFSLPKKSPNNKSGSYSLACEVTEA